MLWMLKVDVNSNNDGKKITKENSLVKPEVPISDLV